jgi:hypothetical protein
MLLSPTHPSFIGDLLRLVACWVAAILLFQGLAASHQRALGPVHHHVPQKALHLALHLASHGHSHDADERHHHAADDHSVRASPSSAAADDAWDAAAAALVVALTLLAVSRPWSAGTLARHVWRATTAWHCLTGLVQPPLKPPRTLQPRS